MDIQEFKSIKFFPFLQFDQNTNAVRERELAWLSEKIGSVGLNLEFGVFSGFSINFLAKSRKDLFFHGFDSFVGLPEDWDMGSKFIRKERFSRDGIAPKVHENVQLYPGWFDKTIPAFLAHNTGMSISFLNIDSDLYSSAITILSELNHLIEKGTIIRFDELACWRTVFAEPSPTNEAKRVLYPKWEEQEWKALTEWVKKYNRRVVPISRDWHQSGTLIVIE
jgi:hypothetical protein